ncbi:MAG: hypothetical protein K2K24_05060 [Clostridia bacterium]|nr:hypothetical protein [Clostridia bacterium]
MPKPEGGGGTNVETPDVVKPDDNQNTEPTKSDVTQLSQINFASKNEYTLKADIALPDNYSVGKVNCTIVGDGNKLVLGKGVTLGELNGNISDLTVENSGNTIFTSISENASIKNVIFNVNADITSTDGRAFVALNNYGTIDGVTLNASGKINVISTSTVDTYGGMVLNNSYKVNAAAQMIYNGVIKNCKVNYSRFTLVGVAGANASFGGVVGTNNAYLQDCVVSGEIIGDTFDIAGICSVNNGLLSGNVNEANLSQTSVDTGWNPIVCGIVMTNAYAVDNCENKGSITAISNCEVEESEENKPTVSAAGIAYVNSSTIVNCINSGSITAKGNYASYVGGIAAHSYTQIGNCLSSGDITVTAQDVYVGGILGISEVTNRGYYVYFGSVNSCISESKIDVSVIGNEPAYVGGIIGCVSEAGFGSEDDLVYFGGGATNCYFIGECVSDVTYFGNIVGVCGANIYESNSYTSGNTEYHNFEDNYYLQNSYKSIGSTVSSDGTFAPAENKGATRTTIEEIKNNETYKKILSALVVD